MSSSPNPKTVVIIGALDTKGAEFAYLKGLIETEGVDTLVVDFGTMGAPALEPDISRAEVAAAAGGDISYLASGEHKDEAMQTMAKGLAVVVRRCTTRGSSEGSSAWVAPAAPRSPPRGCASCPWVCPR